jgi:hypothetical protein
MHTTHFVLVHERLADLHREAQHETLVQHALATRAALPPIPWPTLRVSLPLPPVFALVRRHVAL